MFERDPVNRRYAFGSVSALSLSLCQSADSVCAVPNPYLRPNSQRREADEAKAQFAHPHGDHLSLLNLYHAYRTSEFASLVSLELLRCAVTCAEVEYRARADPDSQWCWANYVSYRAMQQADNVRNQLKRSMEKLDL